MHGDFLWVGESVEDPSSDVLDGGLELDELALATEIGAALVT